MLKNYFKIAWRNILRYKFHAVLNMAGLAIAIAFVLLTGAYMWGELQVNRQLRNYDRQYILTSKWKDPNMGMRITTLGPLAKALKENYPSLVANYYRFDGITSTVSRGDRHFREGLQLSDSTMLKMYGFPVAHGDAQTALNDPFSVVITEERAVKYFGRKNVVRQTLTIESFSGSKHDFIVSAVIKDLPPNSVTELAGNNQFFISVNASGFFGRNMETWQNNYIVGYVELQKGVSPGDLEGPLRHLVKQNASATINSNLQPQLVLLKDFYRSANNGLVKKMLYTLSFIAFFILLMAVINFINISIGRSAARMREIGIRKVLGGLKKQVILQFLIESLVLVLIAALLALGCYELMRPWFQRILGKEVLSFMDAPLYFLGIILLLGVIVGLLAGIYPAFVLSSLRSVDSLKGKLGAVKDNILFRRSLVGLQFCIATVVFTGAIIVSRQIDLFFSRDLGYNKEYIVSAQLPRNWSPQGIRHMEDIRDRFAAMPGVSTVSLSYEIPNGNIGFGSAFYVSGTDSTRAVSMEQHITDEMHAAVYQIPMVAGEFFNAPHMVKDSSKVVITESAVKALGWKRPDEAIGRQLRVTGGGNALFNICGVIKDFHSGSMQQAIQPTIFTHVRFANVYRYMSFKLRPGNVAAAVSALQRQWSALMPDAAFEYSFLDDTLKKLYQSELQLKKASYVATVLALIIVLSGVLGLISLSIQKRTREIGIRKVLGASVQGIISLFLREFIPVIVVAGLIACPLAWWLMDGWLSGYAYRISVTPLPFILAIGVLGCVTALVIGVQTIRLAVTNPSKSLKVE